MLACCGLPRGRCLLSADCHLLRPGFCLFCSVPGLCSLRFSFHQVGFLLQPLMAVSCPAGAAPPPPPPTPTSSFLCAPPHCVPALDSALETHPGLCLAWGWALSPPNILHCLQLFTCWLFVLWPSSSSKGAPCLRLQRPACVGPYACSQTNVWMNFWYLKTLIRTKHCQYFDLLRA